MESLINCDQQQTEFLPSVELSTKSCPESVPDKFTPVSSSCSSPISKTNASTATDSCQHNCEKLFLDIKRRNAELVKTISDLQNTLISESSEKSKNVFYVGSKSKIKIFDREVDVIVKSSPSIPKTDGHCLDSHHVDQSSSSDDSDENADNESEPIADDVDDVIVSMKVDQSKDASINRTVVKIDESLQRSNTRIVRLGDAHHQWVKRLVDKPTKCLACMRSLPLSHHCAECYICKTTVHHLCAENLYNTCGMTILSSDQYFKEELEMIKKFNGIHVCGWMKVWNFPGSNWHSVWASLQNETLSYYESNNVDTEPLYSVQVCDCRLMIRLNSNVAEFLTNENRPLPMKKSDWPVCFKINLTNDEIFVMPPDLPSKQRWLGAFRKYSSIQDLL